MESIVNSRCTNMCGTAYKRGNLVFKKSNDEQLLYSIVGNRILEFNLQDNSQRLLEGECCSDIKLLCLSIDGRVLVAVSVEDQVVTLSTLTGNVINSFRINKSGVSRSNAVTDI